jgi:putative addiction module component (TIGR02574 family)
MNTTYDTVLTGALDLPEDSRVTLVERLLVSLTPDAAIEQEHLATVRRRKAAIDSGAVQPVPGEVVAADVRRAVQQVRGA